MADDVSSSESCDEEIIWRKDVNPANYPVEYWEVQKLIKYLQVGNPTVTLITLCSILDFDLKHDKIQLAFRDADGINTLLNILEADDPKCKMGALKILRDLCLNQFIRRSVVNLGGLKMMAQLLKYLDPDLQCLAAECLANVVKFSQARKIVKQEGAIEILVSFLNSNGKIKNWENLACCGAKALWSCSQSHENRVAMRKAGVIPFLVKLIKSKNKDILVPVAGILEECMIEENYRKAVKTDGMLEYIVKNLNSTDPELQRTCSSVIQKCAEDEESRELVRVYNGLEPLVNIVSSAQTKDLLAAGTGAMWKCSISQANVIRFQELKAIDLLVNLLNNQPEKVLINVVGALAEFSKNPSNRIALRKANGIPALVLLLSGTNDSLLINVANALGHCADDPDCMMIIEKLDGVRLLWSLLKNQNKEVQVAAAWALCPCIRNVKDPGEMVRSFVGGLELIVNLLKSDDLDLLTAICACITEIAQDKESLAVLTDHGVVILLSQLISTDGLLLRHHLAEAISCCCTWNNNRSIFGEEGAIKPLVGYLKMKVHEDNANANKPTTSPIKTIKISNPSPISTGSKIGSASLTKNREFVSVGPHSTEHDITFNIRRSTVKALYELSKHPNNCVTMHKAGVVKSLVNLVGSQDYVTQEASASCLLNIRRLAKESVRQRCL